MQMQNKPNLCRKINLGATFIKYIDFFDGSKPRVELYTMHF